MLMEQIQIAPGLLLLSLVVFNPLAAEEERAVGLPK